MGPRRFAGSVIGQAHKTEASRYDNTLLEGHIRGWDIGIKVVAKVDPVMGELFELYRTSGSNDPSMKQYLGCLTNEEWMPCPDTPS